MSSILQNYEKVKKAVDNCESTRDALHYLGLRSAGGNYDAFKKACSKFGLEQPIGLGAKVDQLRKLAEKNTIPLEQILVENSTYLNRAGIKQKLYKADLLKEECYKCGLGPIWNDKPITLQLEHINGVFNDNRIENLSILCPNCHSQTETFCGKRKAYGLKKEDNSYSKPNNCLDCENAIPKTSIRCYKCEAKYRIKTNIYSQIDWPPLEELIEEVKTTSYVATAKRLGVSDNAVRKHIKRRL